MRVSSSSESESNKKVQKNKKSKKRKKDKGKKKAKDGSCSSSSSDTGAKKKDKKVKKQKKGAKEESKQKKRAERAEAWDCDRAEAVRLIRQLLEVDKSVASELEGVFDQIDDGITVDLNGLENKTIRKKLRHLMQSLGLVCIDGQGFRSADPKVMFRVVFDACLHNAGFRASQGPPAKKVIGVSDPIATRYCPPAEAALNEPIATVTSDFLEPPPVVEPLEGGPAKKRFKGPMLPGASVGPAAVGPSDSDGSGDEAAGPLLEGEERQGIDLRDLPSGSQREQWMTTPHAEVAAAFGDAPAPKGDAFQVKRSAAETADFEKQFKRGPSLLEQTREGQVDGSSREEAERLNGRQQASREMWGTTEKDQKSGKAPGRSDEKVGALHRPFDPEQDMRSVRPMTGDQFQSLVENSQSALSGRFSRSQVATSFL